MQKKIVTISGGHGGAMVLGGLKKYPLDISAIVSMADDGGSTGILRRELGVLPPGDVKECLLALGNQEFWMNELLTYRFDAGSLKGHTVANLLLAALEKINGSFIKGTERLAELLKAEGRVIPVSEQLMTLHIKLGNGEILIGETNLDFSEEIYQFGVKDIFLEQRVQACDLALRAIEQTDMIVIGPGDMYGSILPIFLAEGIVEALEKTKAKIVFVCNPTNRKGQTSDFDLTDYVEMLEKKLGKDKISHVVFSNSPIPDVLSEELRAKEGEGGIVSIDRRKDVSRKYQIIEAAILKNEKIVFSDNDAIASTRAFIQYDGDKLAKVLIKILEE